MMRNCVVKIFSFLLILCVLSSCKKDFYASSQSDVLIFSSDTISFDTLFTEKGSVTQWVKIKNPCDGIVKINKISLASGENSRFFINVNGIPGPVVEDIEIASGDSLFVFIQTKLQEQKVDTILYHEEFLRVDYNSRVDAVVITAWGQDVENVSGILSANTVFTAKKPYVVYDSLVVGEGATLVVEAGARIYMHYNANIIVHGSLKIQGSKDSIVTITSDRLEQTYQLLPGQWGSIIFTNSSHDNEVSYAMIKNGVNGLFFQGDESHQISCLVANSQISNMSGNGLYAVGSRVTSYNSVFANCEYYVVAVLGGWFQGIHNTIYNEGTARGRKYYPSLQVSDYKNDTCFIALENALLSNSIVVGSMTNEISMDAQNGDNSLPCMIQYCLLRDTYTNSDSSYYKNNTFYDKGKSLFKTGTFYLDSLSQAMNIGNLEIATLHPLDILCNSRIADSTPDVGAIEYFYEEKKDEK